MSRTIRIYNKRNDIGVYRKYGYVCMGNCPRCKDPGLSKKTRIKIKEEAIRQIDEWGLSLCKSTVLKILQ